MARSALEARSTMRCLPRIDRLEIELALAFDEEHTVRGLIAARGVAIVPTRLHEIGARSKPEFGLSFRGLNVGPRQDYDLHVVGVRVSGAANPAGNLKNAPNAPLAWLPHRSATLAPGAPGSRSVHFTSLAGMTTSRLAAACEGRLAFASPEACAKTVAGNPSVIPSISASLAVIEPSLPRFWPMIAAVVAA